MSTTLEGVSEADPLHLFFLQHCEPPTCATTSVTGDTGRMLWTQEVDVMKLLMTCPSISRDLFESPISTMEHLRFECAALCSSAENNITPSKISIRFTHFPPIQVSLPPLPPPQGTLVQMCGTIVRMSTKRVVPFLQRFMCPRCRQVVEIYTTPFDRSPSTKKLCEASSTCKKEELQLVDQVWMDYAECRLQQRSGVSGELPRSILVTLDDDLSMKCTVGQFVEVIGILFQKWKYVYPGSRPVIEPTLWASNVMPMEAYRGAGGSRGLSAGEAPQINGSSSASNGASEFTISPYGAVFTPESFFLSFKKKKLNRCASLVRSTCPQLSGLFAPRLAMLLATLGGTPSCTSSLRIRSTIHCLLVGDPSTGKSQLLRYASQISPRSTCTTGMGSTSAGLTVAATKENGEWVLEPGALVLSDGGSCIIDELRTVAVADRASLHEAMEQQTISVAKGGLVTKLRTNCAVIAACNPPHQRGKSGNVTTSVGVGGPLLSRFDLVFLLWDTPQAALDSKIADHILMSYSGVDKAGVAAAAGEGGEPELGGPTLSVEDMAKYLWWIRSQYAHIDGPKLGEHAANLLGCYFNILRARGASPALDDNIPVTIRMLESLVRLTQAYAKLHLQTICTVDDAAMAIFLMERSAHGLKCSLGDEVYSSSRFLDDVFLSEKEEDVRQQQEILQRLVNVVYTYSTTHLHHEGNQTNGQRMSGFSVNATEEEDDLLAQRRRDLSGMAMSLSNPCPTTVRGARGEEDLSILPTQLSSFSSSSTGESTPTPHIKRRENGEPLRHDEVHYAELLRTPRTVSQYQEISEDLRRTSTSSIEALLYGSQPHRGSRESSSAVRHQEQRADEWMRETSATTSCQLQTSLRVKGDVEGEPSTDGTDATLFSHSHERTDMINEEEKGSNPEHIRNQPAKTVDHDPQLSPPSSPPPPPAKRRRTASEIMDSFRFRF